MAAPSGPTEKPDDIYVEDKINVVDDDGLTGSEFKATGGLQPPECLRNMSPEQYAELERRLKRKVDLRLLPMIVIMYLMNYLDRYAPGFPPTYRVDATAS